jgi:hypothetical protein
VVCYQPSTNQQTRFFSYHNAATSGATGGMGGYASGVSFDATRKARRLTCVSFSPNGKFVAAGEVRSSRVCAPLFGPAFVC